MRTVRRMQLIFIMKILENFEGKNKPSEEILYYNRYQNWYIKSELAKANKTDFYNNKKIFQKNMDKIRMLD